MTKDLLRCIVGFVSAGSLAHPFCDGLHQILEVGKDVGIGLVPVFGHNLSVDDHVEFSVGARGEFEGAYILTDPAQSFSCHPGSTQGVASIPTVEYLKFQFLVRCHPTLLPPAMTGCLPKALPCPHRPSKLPAY